MHVLHKALWTACGVKRCLNNSPDMSVYSAGDEIVCVCMCACLLVFTLGSLRHEH